MRGKNFAELLGRQETQGPFAVGGSRGEAGALAGDGVGHGLRIDRENWRVEGNGKAVSVTCKGDRPSPLPGRASGHGLRPPPAYRTGNPPWTPSQGGFPRQRDRKGCKKEEREETGASAPGRVAADLHPGRHSGPLADVQQQVLVLGRELRQRLLPPLVDQGEGEVHALCCGQSL